MTDRRVLRTQTALLQALIGLMSKTSWDDIGVKMICDAADVARSTFYANFDNKHELLDFGFSRLADQMSTTSVERGLALNGKFAFLPNLLEHIKFHSDMFKDWASSPNGSVVFGRFKSLIYKFTKEELANSPFNLQVDDGDVAFLAGGIFGILEQWSSECCQTPVTVVVTRIDKAVLKSLGSA